MNPALHPEPGKITLADLVDPPEHGWESVPVGPFIRHRWAGSGPPRWPLGAGVWQKERNMARSFLGTEPCASVAVVDQALAEVAAYLERIGIRVPPGKTVPVLLWDPVFPLPPVEELGGESVLRDPLTCVRSDTCVIVLPTRCPCLRGETFRKWLRSTAVHEGFHGILWSWLALSRIPGDLERGVWGKFEEMCAVALEYLLAKDTGAWLDFGQAWRGSLALGCDCNDWAALLREHAVTGSVHAEDYGHFPLLAWLDEAIWTGSPGQWLTQAWQTVRGKAGGWHGSPWATLEAELGAAGGRGGLFRRYAEEALFPAVAGGVLDRLHGAYGPPPAVTLRQGEPFRPFIIGWMAVQYLHCPVEVETAGSLQILDPFSRRGLEIRAFWAGGNPAVPPEEIIVSGPRRAGRESLWEISLDRAPPGRNALLVSICQPHFDGPSVLFTAQVR